MGMLFPGIYKKFFVHRTAQFVFGQHAPDAFFDDKMRFLFQHVSEDDPALPTGITCVAYIFFLLNLVAGKADFFSIDNDDIIAGINMWRKRWLVLAPEYVGDAAEQASCCFAICIYNVPFALHFFLLCRFGIVAPSFHVLNGLRLFLSAFSLRQIKALLKAKSGRQTAK